MTVCQNWQVWSLDLLTFHKKHSDFCVVLPLSESLPILSCPALCFAFFTARRLLIIRMQTAATTASTSTDITTGVITAARFIFSSADVLSPIKRSKDGNHTCSCHSFKQFSTVGTKIAEITMKECLPRYIARAWISGAKYHCYRLRISWAVKYAPV